MGLMKRIILKNIFSNWVVYGLLVIVTFIMTPIMLRYLGKIGYGVWLLINSMTGYLSLFDFGMQSSTTKYVAEYIGENDVKKLNVLISTNFISFSVIAFIVFCTTLVLAALTNQMFKIPTEYKTIAPYLVLIVGTEISFSFIFATFIQVFSGIQRYEVHAVVGTLSLLVKSALIASLLMTRHGLLSIALATLAVSLLGKLSYLIFLNHLRLGIEVRISFFDKNTFKMILKYSKSSFLIAIASRVISYTDNIIIGAATSVSGISVYGIASNLVNYMKELVSNATNVLSPAASHAQVSDNSSLKTLALASSKYTVILIAPIAAGFFIVGDSFLSLWLGPGFVETYIILVILTIAQIFSLPLYGMGSILYGIAKHGIVAKIIVSEAAMNLILSLIFVKYWGIIGVALGTAIPSFFLNLLIFPWQIKKVLGVGMGEYYINCLIKPSLMAVPFGISLFVYKNVLGCNTWFHFASGILCAIVVYTLVVYQFELKNLVRIKYGGFGKALRELTKKNR